jgi:hypothetical protein
LLFRSTRGFYVGGRSARQRRSICTNRVLERRIVARRIGMQRVAWQQQHAVTVLLDRLRHPANDGARRAQASASLTDSNGSSSRSVLQVGGGRTISP